VGADFCNALQLLSCINTFANLFEERNTNITFRASTVSHNILCEYCDVVYQTYKSYIGQAGCALNVQGFGLLTSIDIPVYIYIYCRQIFLYLLPCC
jgi:hypothetical protein